MITLEEPHMGLNDSRTPNKVQMWVTTNVKPTTTLQHILEYVASTARSAPGGRLKNLVFRCHGAPAFLQCGTGIGRADAARFVAWRRLVDKIWVAGCGVAYHDSLPGPRNRCAPGVAAGDGDAFCSEIARAAECYVVASTEIQVSGSGVTFPYGKLDTFEGLTLSYGPDGRISWRHRYPSTYRVFGSDMLWANWN